MLRHPGNPRCWNERALEGRWALGRRCDATIHLYPSNKANPSCGASGGEYNSWRMEGGMGGLLRVKVKTKKLVLMARTSACMWRGSSDLTL